MDYILLMVRIMIHLGIAQSGLYIPVLSSTIRVCLDLGSVAFRIFI